MNWSVEQWRKLYTRITGDWTSRLSCFARCMSSELIKYAKDDGLICRTRGRAPELSVALVLNPEPQELEAAQSAALELIADEYLVVRDGGVYILNFEAAQERRTPEAIRQQRHRDKLRSENHSPPSNGIVTHVGHATSQGNDPIRSETNRTEENIHQASPPAPERAQRETFDLQAIYALYPRKGDGKAKGFERLERQIRNRETYEQALQAARNYAAKVQAEQTPLKFVKQFVTWCNGSWRDYVDGSHIVPNGEAPAAVADTRPRPKPYVRRFDDDLEQP